MPTLDDLRTAGERELEGILAKLDKQHRQDVKDAIAKWGRVQDIPEAFWKELRFEIENEQVAAVMLLILAADDWTTDEIASQGVTKRRRVNQRGAALSAARQVQRTSGQTVDTLRKRLARSVEDAKASGPGDVGSITDEGVDQALDDVFTPARRAGIATDETTTAFSTGQRSARDRIGSGDITNEQGQRVTLELIWRTERDNRVCPRCSPLEGEPEAIWSQVFPDGPGPEAHPNCRCSLQPQVIVEEVRESVVREHMPGEHDQQTHGRGGGAIRFAAGQNLTPEQKAEVIKSMGDVYRDAKLDMDRLVSHTKNDEPIYGYPIRPDLFVKSDITGKPIRHYVTLPDGRKAHPSELFGHSMDKEITKSIKQAEIDNFNKVQRVKILTRDKLARATTDKGLANLKYTKTNRKLPGSYFAQHSDGRVVRVDGNDPEDVAMYQDLGFAKLESVDRSDARQIAIEVFRNAELEREREREQEAQPAPPPDQTDRILEAIRDIPQPVFEVLPQPVVNVPPPPEPEPVDLSPVLEAIRNLPQPEPFPEIPVPERVDLSPLLEAINRPQPDIEALLVAHKPEPYDDSRQLEKLDMLAAAINTLAKKLEPKPDKRTWHFTVARNKDQLITDIVAVKE